MNTLKAGIRCTLAGIVFGATTLSAQTITYSVVPTAQRVQWNDDLAFRDDWMYGGRLAVQFGRAVELQPFYFTRSRYGIDASRADALFGPRSVGRTIDLQHYGVSMQINLGSRGIVPFVRGSGGILRLEPDSGQRQDRLAITAGGGLRFGLGQFQAEVFAEQLGFRLNPRGVFPSDSMTGGAADQQRNWVYGGALVIPLSAPRAADEEEEGLRGSSAPIEPFVGRLQYADKLGLADQDLAGVRAGLDFSPLFGVRGFYWRGVNDDRDQFTDVASYGGEAQFNLNTGPGVSPYVVAGAGRIVYGDNFRDSAGVHRDDQTALILGGGISIALSDRFRVNAAIRDYVMTNKDSLNAVSTTSDLTHNTMLSAGLTISIGGTGAAARADDRERAREEQLRDARREREIRDARDERLRERDRRDDMMPMRDSARRMMRDTSVAGRMRDGSRDSGRDSVRTITVPVPVQGEIILRYGLPPSADTMRRSPAQPTVVRDTVIVRSTGRDSTSAQLANELAALEQRLTARIEALRSNTPQTVVVSPPANPGVTTMTRDAEMVRTTTDPSRRSIQERFRESNSGDLRAFSGLSFGDGDAQFVVSGRLDLGPINSGGALHLVPEFAIGFGGDGTSVLATANAQYTFASLGTSRRIRPYVTLGGGIFSPSVLALNTATGVMMDLRVGNATPWKGYLELQGLNFFDHTRLMAGFSIR